MDMLPASDDTTAPNQQTIAMNSLSATDSSTIGGIVGGVLCALIIVALIVVALVLHRRKHKDGAAQSIQPQSQSQSNWEEIIDGDPATDVSFASGAVPPPAIYSTMPPTAIVYDSAV